MWYRIFILLILGCGAEHHGNDQHEVGILPGSRPLESLEENASQAKSSAPKTIEVVASGKSDPAAENFDEGSNLGDDANDLVAIRVRATNTPRAGYFEASSDLPSEDIPSSIEDSERAWSHIEVTAQCTDIECSELSTSDTVFVDTIAHVIYLPSQEDIQTRHFDPDELPEDSIDQAIPVPTTEPWQDGACFGLTIEECNEITSHEGREALCTDRPT